MLLNFRSSMKMLSKYIFHMVCVYLHLHLEMTLRSPKSHTLAEGIFPLLTLTKIQIFLAAISESHHDVLFCRSSCPWRRGRGSIQVSRKSQSANLQLLQTLRHPIVMMRYDSFFCFNLSSSTFCQWQLFNNQNPFFTPFV